MERRVVLFGECGFVGSSLLKHCEFENVVAPTLEQADFTRVDSIRSVLRAGDVVINAAGYANATDTTERGKALFQTINVDGLRNLARACEETQVAHLVHISSVAAMGRWHQDGVTEDMMAPVKTLYAASKLEGERLLVEFAAKLPVTILRPTSVFGEGRGLAGTLCGLVSRGTVPLPNGGRAKIPFTYVGNIAHAVKLAAGNPNCYGRTFIIGDVGSYPLRAVVMALADGMGIRVRILPIPGVAAAVAARGLEVLAGIRGTTPVLDRGRLETMTQSVSYSIAAFRSATGYEPPYSMPEAARRIASWYLAQRGGEGEAR